MASRYQTMSKLKNVTTKTLPSPRTPIRSDGEMAASVNSPPIPTISDRLGHLRPSRELLEFYRRKIADYDEEHEKIAKKLESYRETYQDQHKLQWEVRQRDDEIGALQKALSDMQLHLFQEREHVLRLYAENDRLKIQELDDKKKIHQLLALSSSPEGGVTYFLKEPPARAIVPQKPSARQHGTNRGAGDAAKPKALKKSPTVEETDAQLVRQIETLSLQVESLHGQLEEQTRLAKEQNDALREERRVKEEEIETRQQRDSKTITLLTEKLQKTQDLLYDSTKDFLDLRYEGRANERHWMNEKDQLLRDLDACKDRLTATGPDASFGASPAGQGHGVDCKQHTDEIRSLDGRLEQSHKLSEMYREQVIQLEDELSRIKEEGDVTKEIFQDRSVKMSKRLKLMNSRYQDLEKRRNLEVEGFKNDIKNLRSRLKDVERQLYKVTMGIGEIPDECPPDNIDMHILRNIRNTAGRSKQIVGEIKNLKAKVYSMENDLRHL